jgi:hypothetical protein
MGINQVQKHFLVFHLNMFSLGNIAIFQRNLKRDTTYPLLFKSCRNMTPKSQHQRNSKSCLVEPQQPTTFIQQSLATSHEQHENENSRATLIEELVAPAFSFPFAGKYNTELELDIPKNSNTTPLFACNLNTQNQRQLLHIPIARPWDQQISNQAHQQDACSYLGQAPLGVWENQGPVEEPFNCIGEVILLSGCCVTEEFPQQGGQKNGVKQTKNRG